MDHCRGGTTRRAAGLLPPADPRSNTVKRSLKADGVGAVGREGATKSRATRRKEPGD
jgi:hypothetical protein